MHRRLVVSGARHGTLLLGLFLVGHLVTYIESTCPQSWLTLNDTNSKTCVKFITSNRLSPSYAAKDCQQKGGYLYRDTSYKLHLQLVPYVYNLPRTTIWIGLAGGQNKNWKWIDGPDVGTFQYWINPDQGNPSQTTCGYIYSGDRPIKWRTTKLCDRKRQYICQRDYTSTSTQIPITDSGSGGGQTDSGSGGGQTDSSNCGHGWEEDPSSAYCFLFLSARRTWREASVQCSNLQGHLASILTAEQQTFLTGRSARYRGQLFWTGGNDLTEGGWSWPNYQPFAFFNWAKIPNNKNSADCITMTMGTGEWHAADCSLKYGYICKRLGKKIQTTPKPRVTPKAPKNYRYGCPANWRQYVNSCYYMPPTTEGVTWAQAKHTCEHIHSKLLTIADKDENNFVYSYLRENKGFGRMWIGLNDLKRESSFSWHDGTDVTFTKWYRNQPSNYNGGQDCVAMSNWNGFWMDLRCNTRQKEFMCKQPALLVSTLIPENQKGCPKHTIGYLAKCYSFYATRSSFNDAEKTCKSIHKGHLATLDTRYIQAFVTAELSTYHIESAYIWIGLSSTTATGNKYAWTSGSNRIDYINWDRTHTGKESNTCVAIYTAETTGLWINQNCNNGQPFICELPRTGYTNPPAVSTPDTTLSCPSDWFDIPGSKQCYKMVTLSGDVTTWPLAKTICESFSKDAMLATINSKDISDKLKKAIGPPVYKDAVTTLWLGLNDRNAEGSYQWLDGTAFTYNKWNSSEPDDKEHRDDCVQWDIVGDYWFTTYCYTFGYPLCQMPRNSVMYTPAPTPTIGPSGGACGNSSWTLFSGNCYYTSPFYGPGSILSWFDAETTCNQMFSHLVSIATEDENAYVTSILHYDRETAFWTGLTDLKSYEYSWSDETSSAYFSWDSNQPDDKHSAERCVQMDHNGLWSDSNCQTQLGFVCKKSVNGTDFFKTPKPDTVYTGGCQAPFRTISSIDRCYYIGGTKGDQTDWDSADGMCKKILPKSRLASVHTSYAYDFIRTMMMNIDGPVWTGMNTKINPKVYTWLDNENADLNSYSITFFQNYINKDKQCGVMAGKPETGKFNFEECGNKHPYLCQFKKDPTKLPQYNTTGCKDGYKRVGFSCYKFVIRSLYSWKQAQSACQAEGSRLVSITSSMETSAINVIIDANVKDTVWIGLKLNSDTLAYEWTDNQPMRYTNWGPNEQKNLKNLCIGYTVNFGWQHMECDTQNAYICEEHIDAPPTPAPTVAQQKCEIGWKKFGNNCYILVKEKQGIGEADDDCYLRNPRSTLVSIHSKAESQFITSWLKKANVDSWLGMFKLKGGKFVWSDNSEMEFWNWASGKPSITYNYNFADHECAFIQTSDGKWTDTNCVNMHPYICKVEPANVFTTAPGWVSSGGKTGGSGGSLSPNTLFPDHGVHSKVSSSSGMSGGAVAGLVIGLIVLVALLVVGAFFGRRYYQNRPSSSGTKPSAGFDNVIYDTQKDVTISTS